MFIQLTDVDYNKQSFHIPLNIMNYDLQCCGVMADYHFKQQFHSSMKDADYSTSCLTQFIEAVPMFPVCRQCSSVVSQRSSLPLLPIFQVHKQLVILGLHLKRKIHHCCCSIQPLFPSWSTLKTSPLPYLSIINVVNMWGTDALGQSVVAGVGKVVAGVTFTCWWVSI